MTDNNDITAQCEAETDAAMGASPDDLALLCRSRSVVVAAFDGKSTGDLKTEFGVYASHADALRDHHVAARQAFLDNHTVYTQMFTKVELLDQLAQFEFLGATPEDRDDFSIIWDGVMGTVGDSVGAAISIGGVLYSALRYRKMSRLVKQGTALGSADDAATSALKMAKSSKAIAVGGGVFSLAMAGLTIASAIKNEVETHQALETDLGKYADWYSETRENAILFCFWAKTMRSEIRELKRNFSEDPDGISDEAFIAKLDGFMIKAGELDAQVRLATRMLCDGLEPSTVVGYTDLNMTVINYIVGQISFSGSTVCQDAAAS